MKLKSILRALCVGAVVAVVMFSGCGDDGMSGESSGVNDFLSRFSESAGDGGTVIVECPAGNFSLTVSRNIDAGGTLSNYGGDCYAPGTPATVSVTSVTPDYWFTGWSGADTSPNTTVTITMNSNQLLIANFKAITYYTITANVAPAGAGTVSISPELPRYPDTMTVSINAVPNAGSGYAFTGWSGTSTSANPIIWTKNGNWALTANFQRPIMGTFTDSRNSQTYRTVKIGNGKTWMAENLNYETANSWCYNNINSNCATYGRLYTWDAAMSACPSGWSLPDTADWNALVRAAGGWEMAGTTLKSATGWNNNGNGTDAIGFSALPAGYRNTDGTFYHAGTLGYWWSATESGSGYAYFRDMSSDLANVYEINYGKGGGFSARCVR